MLDLTGTHRPWPDDLLRMWSTCVGDAVVDRRCARTPPWRGHPGLRAVLAEALALEEPYVTAGVRALVPAFALLGRRVIIERPTFDGVRHAFVRCGANVVSHQLDVALEVARPAHRYLLWISSPHRNPDGWSLSASDVDRLAAFVNMGGVVVQNETHRWFGSGGYRVPGAYVIGSLSKLAGGWARTGWLSGELDDPVHAFLRSATPPTPWQAAWARFADVGGLRMLSSRARKIGDVTRHHARQLARPGDSWFADSISGASVVLQLDVANPVEHLARLGVAVGPGRDFGCADDSVRISFLGCRPDCDHGRLLSLARDGGRLAIPRTHAVS